MIINKLVYVCVSNLKGKANQMLSWAYNDIPNEVQAMIIYLKSQLRPHRSIVYTYIVYSIHIYT